VEVPIAKPAASTSPVALIGLFALCAYLISGYATDLSYRFLGSKPYLSMISGVVVFLCFIISGRAFEALKTTVGKLWLALGVWMCLAVVFSRWIGGSFEVMQVYLPKQHLVLFYMAAFAGTIKHCRTVLRAWILGGFILILVCIFFGVTDDSGRFAIPTNIYLMNPNDLAMQLLLCLGFFLFLVRQPSWVGRVTGVVGVLGASYYLLKTASRGAMLACVVFALLWLLFSENRPRLVIMALPVMLIFVAMMPGGTLHRLSLIVVNPVGARITSALDEKALESQMERQHLLKESLKYAITHPLFGIGPGRFSDAIWEDGKKQGRHEASLGTHNSYTQIAAECGLPALIIFLAAIIITFRSSYRLCRATINDKSQGLVAALAFTCCVMTGSFAIDVFFHHVAYTGNMAMVLGLWVSTELATKKELPAYWRTAA